MALHWKNAVKSHDKPINNCMRMSEMRPTVLSKNSDFLVNSDFRDHQTFVSGASLLSIHMYA